MDLAELAARSGCAIEDDQTIKAKCPLCGGRASLFEPMPGVIRVRCEHECRGLHRQVDAIVAGLRPPSNGNGNGHVPAHLKDPEQALASGKYELAVWAKQWAMDGGFREIYPDNAEFGPRLLEQLIWAIGAKKIKGFEGLSQSEIGEECQTIVDAYCPIVVEADSTKQALIVCENFAAAMTANEEYLKRPEIIERLAYGQSISLTVGGKHNGKTTILRTKALCVLRGLPFFGRATTQGPVVYAASDDELASTRMELLRMGWNAQTDPLTLVHIRSDIVPDPEQIIDQIGEVAVKCGAIYIILDMLFDFAGIKDEMSYAHTREAIGKIQRLADATLAHVDSSHHSPKYMLDTASAATAALGSQGIAARFSPITLARRWADSLYTIESTMTRDPRGLALPQRLVTVNELGWAQDGGEFKTWMKWRMHAPRVMGLIEGDEPGKEFSVDAVARALEIARPDAQNALYRLFLDKQLDRTKKGRSYRYWLPMNKETLLDSTDEAFERKFGGESQN